MERGEDCGNRTSIFGAATPSDFALCDGASGHSEKNVAETASGVFKNGLASLLVNPLDANVAKKPSSSGPGGRAARGAVREILGLNAMEKIAGGPFVLHRQRLPVAPLRPGPSGVFAVISMLFC